MRVLSLCVVVSVVTGCKKPPEQTPQPALPGDVPANAAPVLDVGPTIGETRLFNAQVATLEGGDRPFLVVGGFTRTDGGRASRVPVFARQADGSWALRWEASWSEGRESSIRNVEVADLDGDGRQEIVAYGRIGDDPRNCRGQLRVLGVKDDKLVVLAEEFFLEGENTHGYGMDTGDVTGDGKPEILGGGFSRHGDVENGDLRVWSYSAGKLRLLASERFAQPDHTSTRVNSVAYVNLRGVGPAIVTGGRNGRLKPRSKIDPAEPRNETGEVIAWRVAGGTLEQIARHAWHSGTTTRIRTVRGVDLEGDGADELLMAGQCDTEGKPCMGLLAWSGNAFKELTSSSLDVPDGEIKDVVVIGKGTGVRVATTGAYGKKPHRQAELQLWKVSPAGLSPEKTWHSKNAAETRARAVLVWPGENGFEVMTVGHATDENQYMIGQLLDWDVAAVSPGTAPTP